MSDGTDNRYSWRAASSWLLLLLGCLLFLVSVVTIWVDNLVLDTDRYVETVAPLSQNEAIDNAVADGVTDLLFEKVEVENRLHEALPQQIQFLAGPLTDRTKGYTRDSAYDVLTSDRFNQLWVDANRKAHEGIVSLLTGEGEVLSARQGEVVLDLTPIIEDVVNRMGETGQSIFGNVSSGDRNLQFVIFESDTLASIQSAVALLRKLAIALPILALASLAGAILLSFERRRMVLFVSAGIAVAMVLLLVSLNIFRTIYLDSAASAELSVPAAAALFDTMVRFLKEGTRTLIILGLFIASAAALAGPSSAAVLIRDIVKRGVLGLGRQMEKAGKGMGPAGEWISEYKRLLQAGGLAVSFLILIFWDWPGLGDLLILAVIVAIYLILVELLGRAGQEPAKTVP